MEGQKRNFIHMITIIAGSRGVTDYNFLEECIRNAEVHKGIKITKIITGECKNSPDEMAEEYAERNNITYEGYPALWILHGKAAGPKRNRKMARKADAAIILWDTKSKGTKNMIKEARKNELLTAVFTLGK